MNTDSNSPYLDSGRQERIARQLDALASLDDSSLFPAIRSYCDPLIRQLNKKGSFLLDSMQMLASPVTGKNGVYSLMDQIYQIIEELEEDYHFSLFSGRKRKRQQNALHHQDPKLRQVLEKLDHQKQILSQDLITVRILEDEIKPLCQKLMENLESLEMFYTWIHSRQNLERKDQLLDEISTRIEFLKQVLLVNEQNLVSFQVYEQSTKQLCDAIDRIESLTLNALKASVLFLQEKDSNPLLPQTETWSQKHKRISFSDQYAEISGEDQIRSNYSSVKQNISVLKQNRKPH